MRKIKTRRLDAWHVGTSGIRQWSVGAEGPGGGGGGGGSREMLGANSRISHVSKRARASAAAGV